MLSDVSIHAPVKGATCVDVAIAGLELVSIHAPVKGATCAHDRYISIVRFQSTRP